MKKIFLCCAAGMSTSMLVKKMLAEAESRGIEAKIVAVGLEDFDNNIADYDCCLLGPQIKYKLKEFQEKGAALGKPVDVINQMDYGMMKGGKVLDQALALID